MHYAEKPDLGGHGKMAVAMAGVESPETLRETATPILDRRTL